MKIKQYITLEANTKSGVYEKYSRYRTDYKIHQSIHVIIDNVDGIKKHTYRLVVTPKNWFDKLLDKLRD